MHHVDWTNLVQPQRAWNAKLNSTSFLPKFTQLAGPKIPHPLRVLGTLRDNQTQRRE